MADLKRFFVKNVIGETVVLDGEEFNHAVNVLRVREQENIILLDNTGFEYISKITKINKKNLEVLVLEKRQNDKEAKTEVTLICGYLKGDKTELVVQKAVELGVKKIVTFSSEFSSSFMNDNKLLRLNKVSIEASKQCGRGIAPKVEYAKDFKSALEFGLSSKNKLFACEFATKSDVDFCELEGDTCVVIGSEGGFSKQEYEQSLNMGYKTVFLGKRILRAETACIALTAIIMNSLKELE